MPTYEYACRKCGQHLEFVQSFKDDALTTCPHCKGKLRKVFGNIGISFKGSGFYKTDSRPKSGAAPAKGDRADPAATAAGAGDAAATSGSGSSTPGSNGSGSSGSGSSGSGSAGSGPSDAKSGGSSKGKGTSGTTSTSSAAS